MSIYDDTEEWKKHKKKHRKNTEYWAKRFEQLEQIQHDKSDEYFQDIERIYQEAARDIESDIAKWYTRYAVGNGISYTDAIKQLTRNEKKELRMSVEEYVKKGQSLDLQWAEQLENASIKFHVSRLEALQVQMEQRVNLLMANQNEHINRLIKDIYTEGYYKTAFELMRGTGVGFEFMKLDANKVDKIISKPWAIDGKNFSERIWGDHRKALVDRLQKDLSQSIMRGQAPDKLIKKIAREFLPDEKGKRHGSLAKAANLVYTESAFFNTAAQKDTFNELGVKEYEIVATLDSLTSDTCRYMDKKHFSMDEHKVGYTAPPFHQRCRTVTAPYFPDDDVYERASRDKDDSGYYTVPGDMDYPAWKKKYIDTVEDEKAVDKKPSIRDQMSIQLDKLTTDEKEVIKKMTGALSQKINTAIGDGRSLDLYNDRIQLIDSALDKGVIPEDIVLLRKTASHHLFPQGVKPTWEMIKDLEGTVITNRIYTSTSFDDFDYPLRDVEIQLHVPKGYKGALYIKKLAYDKYKYQEEVLFKRNLSYYIDNIELKDGKILMSAEVIND